MSNGQEKEFAEGIYYKPPSEKAPDFVLGNLSLQRERLIKWLESKEGDYVNLKILRSRGGKEYIEVDTWKPSHAAKPQLEQPADPPSVVDGFDDSDIPF